MKIYHEIFANNPLRIVTRQSTLARAQTDIVTAQLGDLPFDVTAVSTSGDEVLDRPLVEIGGKGVFIKALEAEMILDRADAAVHSFKDMEIALAEGTCLCAVLPREDRRDALIGPYARIEDLPQGAKIGTSSVRRAALLRHKRPDLQIALLRGNVQRRLRQLDEGHYDAIILAMAGLKRIGLAERGHPIPEEVMMPAASQGVIAIQIATNNQERAEAMQAIFDKMNCEKTAISTQAERALLGHLDGSCRTPIGAMADIGEDGQLTLSAVVLNTDGTKCFHADASAAIADAHQLGVEVAEDLLSQCGGRGFLA